MKWVSRAEWGARPPKGTSPLQAAAQRGLAVHWEGPRMPAFGHERCASKVQGIQRFHMDSRSWNDIAYNFVVCPHGYVYEGRGWGNRSAANGTDSANSTYHAVCYLGGEGNPFTHEAQVAITQLRNELIRRYPIADELRPHSAFKPTACPGDEIRRWVAANAQRPTTEVKPMFDPPLTIAAWCSVPGGVVAVAPDGAVFCEPASLYKGGPNGQPYWGNRRAARIEPSPGGYTVVATTGERYAYPL